jgi:hypothetical protein
LVAGNIAVHQPDVIDHDQVQPHLVNKAARFAPKINGGNRRGIVDVNRQPVQPILRFGKERPFPIGKLPIA